MKETDSNEQAGYWHRLKNALFDPKVDEAVLEASLREARSRMPVPVFWLLGKTQAGKTSIIHALTGSEAAEIGNGFQPCTRSTRFYDFPPAVPVVRFLDTRGLGEVSYDPGEDIVYCESQAHLLLAVMKVADTRQDAVIEVLRTIRKSHPEWPVILVQTGLHERYPHGSGHIQTYPYADLSNPDIPPDLVRALQAQRRFVDDLPGSAPVKCIAVDLTLAEDGFLPVDYGLEALWRLIEEILPVGLQSRLCSDEKVRDIYAQTASQHMIAYALVAAGVGAVPVVDIVAVTGVQAKLLHTLASLYGHRWDRRTISEFMGLLGGGVAAGLLSRMLGRSLIKLIPFWGQTVGAVWGASSSGAATYALGKAAVYFFAESNAGQRVDPAILRRVYTDALAGGTELLKQHMSGTHKHDPSA